MIEMVMIGDDGDGVYDDDRRVNGCAGVFDGEDVQVPSTSPATSSVTLATLSHIREPLSHTRETPEKLSHTDNTKSHKKWKLPVSSGC